jgi:hypothetical protein
VAGNDDGDRVLVIGASYRTIGMGMTDGSGYVSVGYQFSIGDLFELPPNELLKRRSLGKELEGEALALPSEILVELSNPFLHAPRKVAIIGTPFLHETYGYDSLRGSRDFHRPDGRRIISVEPLHRGHPFFKEFCAR